MLHEMLGVVLVNSKLQDSRELAKIWQQFHFIKCINYKIFVEFRRSDPIATYPSPTQTHQTHPTWPFLPFMSFFIMQTIPFLKKAHIVYYPLTNTLGQWIVNRETMHCPPVIEERILNGKNSTPPWIIFVENMFEPNIWDDS